MFFAFAFGIDDNIIEVHYHKNVKLIYQDLVNIALEYGQCVGLFKRYDLILEIAIAGSEGCFSFIFFSDSHSMVGIGQIKLSETSSLI